MSDQSREPGNPTQAADEGMTAGSRPEESDSAPGSEEPEPGRADKKSLPVWQETLLLLVIALGLAVLIKALFLQAFYIPSGSMHDTLLENDRILVQKVSYWGGGQPERGDIVVFDDPGGWLRPAEVQEADNPLTKAMELFGLYPTGGHLVKRVIGVGGDTVRCCDKQGRVVVNGRPLQERSYLADGAKPSLIKFKVTVPDNDLWVMGDNRQNSADSRLHMGDPGGGFIPEGDVVGKVFTVVWPFDRATILHRPQTFEDVPAAR